MMIIANKSTLRKLLMIIYYDALEIIFKSGGRDGWKGNMAGGYYLLAARTNILKRSARNFFMKANKDKILMVHYLVC